MAKNEKNGGNFGIGILGILLAAMFAIPSPAFASGPDNLVFHNFTIADGLPNNSIRAILQDRQGFMWFGTQNGLARYDGQEWVIHSPEPLDPNSICGRLVDSLFEDSTGRIWVATIKYGLCFYDPQSDLFTKFNDLIPETWIKCITEDSDGTLLVSTNELEIFRLNPDTHQATRIFTDSYLAKTPDEGMITDILVDSRNQIWISRQSGQVHIIDHLGNLLNILDVPTSANQGGTLSYANDIFEGPEGRIWITGLGGILKWDPVTLSLTSYVPNIFNQFARENRISVAAIDLSGTLWVGCEGGVLRYDSNLDQFTLFEHKPNEPHSIGQGPILSILCDDSGIIWLGRWQGGLSMLDPNGSIFEVFTHDPGNPSSLHMDAVRSVFEDSRGNLWIGSGTSTRGPDKGGLNLLAKGTKNFQNFIIPDIQTHVIESIVEGTDGHLWLGTNAGLWTFNTDSLQFSQHRPNDPLLVDLNKASVRSLLTLDDHSLWAGTRDAGLWHFDSNGHLLHHYIPDPANHNSIKSRSIVFLFQDTKNRLLTSSGIDGVSIFHPETNDFRHFSDPNRYLNDSSSILEDKNGIFWIGGNSGLITLNIETGEIVPITHSLNTPENSIRSMIKDDRGRIWLSTLKGMTLFDPQDKSLLPFYVRDGLPTNDGSFNALLTKNKMAYFSSLKGLIRFKPDHFVPSGFSPNIQLVGLRVHDQPLTQGPDSPLNSSVSYCQSIELPHDQNSLTVSFTSLDFLRPGTILYRHRLEGLSSQWSEPSSTPHATFANLSPGTYYLEVQGTNHDRTWSNNNASLTITIATPWYRTALASIVFIILIMVIFALGFWAMLQWFRKREAVRLRLAEADKLEELDKIKSRFFANISHEFRTPLTLIEGILQRQQKNPASINAERSEMLFRNTRRLKELIDQLLDLARLESGKFHLKWTHDDLNSFMRTISSPFKYLAAKRNLHFTVQLQEAELMGWFDKRLVETIVTNLLSNAMKFTPDGKDVDLFLETGSSHTMNASTKARLGLIGPIQYRNLSIKVTNTGTYIPPGDIDRIFNRFLQAATHRPEGNVGSGIGLSLVKELVDHVGGEAIVSSERGSETVFAVTIPFIVSGLTASPSPLTELPDDKDQNLGTGEIRSASIASPASATASNQNTENVVTGSLDHGSTKELPLLLIVEDSLDLQQFLSGELESDYQVLLANDGLEGWKLAQKQIPDIIISDVMMPRMDGFEFLTKLKEDPATNHVPVIMLTAKTEAESRMQGLTIGADDYLAKPLDPEELRVRAGNLIKQRELLRQKYTSSIESLRVKDLPMTSQDERFLAEAMTVIEDNLEREDFTVEDFARCIGLSRTQLHRKLKALTGKPATAVIRQQRLRRAASLLATKYGNVAEVAYAVGFKSLSHFSQYFKDEFGVLPSKYKGPGDHPDKPQ